MGGTCERGEELEKDEVMAGRARAKESIVVGVANRGCKGTESR